MYQGQVLMISERKSIVLLCRAVTGDSLAVFRERPRLSFTTSVGRRRKPPIDRLTTALRLLLACTY